MKPSSRARSTWARRYSLILGKPSKYAVDDLLRLVGRDVEPRRETPRVHAVGEPVVHGLGAAPKFAVDLIDRQIEDGRGRRRVDVVAGRERLARPSSPDRWARILSSIWE